MTIDPARDDAAAMKQYTDYLRGGLHRPDRDRRRDRAGRRGMGRLLPQLPSDSASGYAMAHSTDAYLVDAEGQLRHHLFFGAGADLIADTLRGSPDNDKRIIPRGRNHHAHRIRPGRILARLLSILLARPARRGLLRQRVQGHDGQRSLGPQLTKGCGRRRRLHGHRERRLRGRHAGRWLSDSRRPSRSTRPSHEVPRRSPTGMAGAESPAGVCRRHGQRRSMMGMQQDGLAWRSRPAAPSS